MSERKAFLEKFVLRQSLNLGSCVKREAFTEVRP